MAMLKPAPHTLTADHHSQRKELYALCAAFFVLGACFATWASRIPAIRDSAQLVPATLGYVLLARGFSTVVVMPAVAKAIQYFGARPVAFSAGLMIIGSLIPLTLVNNWLALSGVMLVTGAGFSAYNVSINALGSDMESMSGRSHMSKMHSWFGVGNLGGALVGTGLAGLDVSAFLHFSIMTGLLILVLIFSFRNIPDREPDEAAKAAKLSWPNGPLIWLGMIVFMAASIEASVNNWVALFFTDRLGVEGGMAPLGYASFAGSLLMVRLIGDRLKMKFGARKLLIGGSFLATGGMVLALSTFSIPVVVTGFFACGAGVALTFPMVFSAAGKQSAMALASVATFGYLGGMISQPLMGTIVSNFELIGGFTFIGVMMLSVSFFTWKADLLKS